MSPPAISVVVITLGTPDRRAGLARLVAHLMTDPVGAEVIVVDQGRCGAVELGLVRWTGDERFRLVPSSLRGLSRTRNEGLEHVTSPLVSWLDDDVLPVGGTLASVVEHLDDHPEDDLVCLGVGTKAAGGPPVASLRVLPPRRPLEPSDVLESVIDFGLVARVDRLRAADVRFDPSLGVGAGTPWGSDEGPMLVLEAMRAGLRVVARHDLEILHPEVPVDLDDPGCLVRALSYSGGRGRLSLEPELGLRRSWRSWLRPALGVGWCVLRRDWRRAAYYRCRVTGFFAGRRSARWWTRGRGATA